MDAHSFTEGADYRVLASTMTGFSGGSTGTVRDIIAFSGATILETEDKDGTIGTTSSTGDTIVAIVGVDRERGAPEWNVIAGIGEFTGSFIITL